MFLFLIIQSIQGQISPGDLTAAHAELEGISNCTKCHDLGKQISKAKCLECHSEISDLINKNRGYHSNPKVAPEDCWDCHGEHYGRTFKIINFDPSNFDHHESGFELIGKHKSLKCKNCHSPEFIIDKKLRAKKDTFLGLGVNCKNCHEDIHLGTLGKDCKNCHTEEKFKPAIKFSHDKTNFRLDGMHKGVACIECHKKESVNSKTFQHFTGIKFNSCSNCHYDIHKGKLGNDCKSCHNTESFKKVNIKRGFDHSKTNFELIGKHKKVPCENCHENSLSSKPKFQYCFNCHEDYHKGEFIKDGNIIDCIECHNENGFSPSTFSLHQHSLTTFPLSFAHASIPCTKCHYSENIWKFKIKGDLCIECHTNIHNKNISEKFFNEEKCETCHSTNSWQQVNFDHKLTSFELLGQHEEIACSKCHFTYDGEERVGQKFRDLETKCINCHRDIHFGQFTEAEKELCIDCHTFNNWQPSLFDHNKTRFILDGAHKKLKCKQCHKSVFKKEDNYVKYKIEDISCKSCHS